MHTNAFLLCTNLSAPAAFVVLFASQSAKRRWSGVCCSIAVATVVVFADAVDASDDDDDDDVVVAVAETATAD